MRTPLQGLTVFYNSSSMMGSCGGGGGGRGGQELGVRGQPLIAQDKGCSLL